MLTYTPRNNTIRREIHQQTTYRAHIGCTTCNQVTLHQIRTDGACTYYRCTVCGNEFTRGGAIR